MYQPAQFVETRPEAMAQLMHEHAFGTLVTLDSDGLNANHLPFDFEPAASSADLGTAKSGTDGAPFGTLRAHVARNNPVWQDTAADLDVLVIFQGPHTYISPSWYATKKEHGRVVPTWNYMVVHAYGRLRAIEDPAWLRAALERLTSRHERGMARPWQLSDAPTEYIGKLLPSIVGIEISVTRLIGKWKVSQNQPQANRAGVVHGLRASGGEQACAMADAVAGAVVNRARE